MRLFRFSLFTKVLLWFFLNLLLLGLILTVIFNFRFESRPSFLGRAGNRIETLTRLISEETNGKGREERDEILRQYSENYNVQFFLFDNQGNQLAGTEITLPTEILDEVKRAEPLFPPQRPINSNILRELPPKFPRGRLPGRPPSIYLRTTNPTVYWFVGRTMIFEREKSEPVRARLLAASNSFTGNGLFFDPVPYIIVAGVIVGFSILFWFPFVRRITRSIALMTYATEQIAEEQFDVQLNEKRADEIGRLGKAINHLAGRLSGFVHGQKRFLGDISHELNSPLARMQFALSILEDRVDEKNRSYVADVKEEVELMSKLVSELLAYSKAGIRAPQIELEHIALRPLVERVVERETAKENAEIKIEIDENLKVLAQRELLSRAFANVIRNAVRYAGDAGTILITAENANNQVKITVADKGAGVPESELEKLFDPFYRIETDRARQTGGTGLGLAIVKTCVEACQGKVFARNNFPAGLMITMILKN